MAEVVLVSGQQKQVWTTKFLTEYIRESALMPYMGTGPNNIIQLRRELQTTAGAVINVPLISRLKGSGVVGAEVLEGNEEDLGTYNDQIRVNWLRNGVTVPKSTSYATDIDLLDAARPMLKAWSAEKLRDAVITALNSIIIPGAADTVGLVADTAVAYGSATASQLNTYLVNNIDRVLMGVLKSNTSSNVWATSLANVDSTNDKMSTTVLSLAKRMAKNADPHIRPYRTEDGREFFVALLNSLQMRDLKADPVMQQANRDARVRGVDTNPIFQDGDLMWDGVLAHEVPEMPVIAGAGAAGVDVALAQLCGQQAVAVAYGQDPRLIPDPDRDYNFRPSVGIEELRGQKKTSFAGKQYGVVTIVTTATGDA
jgi:hypothetical protein